MSNYIGFSKKSISKQKINILLTILLKNKSEYNLSILLSDN